MDNQAEHNNSRSEGDRNERSDLEVDMLAGETWTGYERV